MQTKSTNRPKSLKSCSPTPSRQTRRSRSSSRSCTHSTRAPNTPLRYSCPASGICMRIRATCCCSIAAVLPSGQCRHARRQVSEHGQAEEVPLPPLPNFLPLAMMNELIYNIIYKDIFGCRYIWRWKWHDRYGYGKKINERYRK